jgi:exonuclease SbcD
VISGNHDNPARFAAIAPLLALGNVTVLARPAKADEGGLTQFTAPDGTSVRLAQMPFVSKRLVVRAAELMSKDAYEASQGYTETVGRILASLCADFDASSVNLLSLHGFLQGGEAGGGERPAHLIEDYHISSHAIPAATTYAALGHLHRPQLVPGAAPIHYCGSPLQMDFGERDQQKVVNVVEAVPGAPAKVTEVPLTAGRQLIQLSGDPQQVIDAAQEGPPNAWLKAILTGPVGSGVADDMRETIGERLVDIRVKHSDVERQSHEARLAGHTPQELFEMFLREQGKLVGDSADPALMGLFNDLLDAHSTVGAS